MEPLDEIDCESIVKVPIKAPTTAKVSFPSVAIFKKASGLFVPMPFAHVNVPDEESPAR